VAIWRDPAFLSQFAETVGDPRTMFPSARELEPLAHLHEMRKSNVEKAISDADIQRDEDVCQRKAAQLFSRILEELKQTKLLSKTINPSDELKVVADDAVAALAFAMGFYDQIKKVVEVDEATAARHEMSLVLLHELAKKLTALSEPGQWLLLLGCWEQAVFLVRREHGDTFSFTIVNTGSGLSHHESKECYEGKEVCPALVVAAIPAQRMLSHSTLWFLVHQLVAARVQANPGNQTADPPVQCWEYLYEVFLPHLRGGEPVAGAQDADPARQASFVPIPNDMTKNLLLVFECMFAYACKQHPGVSAREVQLLPLAFNQAQLNLVRAQHDRAASRDTRPADQGIVQLLIRRAYTAVLQLSDAAVLSADQLSKANADMHGYEVCAASMLQHAEAGRADSDSGTALCGCTVTATNLPFQNFELVALAADVGLGKSTSGSSSVKGSALKIPKAAEGFHGDNGVKEVVAWCDAACNNLIAKADSYPKEILRQQVCAVIEHTFTVLVPTPHAPPVGKERKYPRHAGASHLWSKVCQERHVDSNKHSGLKSIEVETVLNQLHSIQQTYMFITMNIGRFGQEAGSRVLIMASILAVFDFMAR
jgi:hypothetical protein